MSIETENRPDTQAITKPQLSGVHHTARPTWKLAKTLHFYRDVMSLKLCHAISAKGWGPEDHPDFLHLFFDSGQGSTIAFFYYLKTEKPADPVAFDHWLFRSVHTAWRVETREELLSWREQFERHGLEVMQVRHEIIESIYVTDPNGYMVEIGWQMRPMVEVDAYDAALTLEAAVAIEQEQGRRIETIAELWQRKAMLIRRDGGTV